MEAVAIAVIERRLSIDRSRCYVRQAQTERYKSGGSTTSGKRAMMLDFLP